MSTSTETSPNEFVHSGEMPLKLRLRQMVGRTRMAAAYVMGRQPVDRSMTIFDDDVWYTSYPRSGNTYWRFLTANLISGGEPVDWTNIERLSPDIYCTYERDLLKIPRPRYIKSHEPFKPAYRRVVLIVRDPRDVAVSCFHFAKRWHIIPERLEIDHFIPHWIAGRIFTYGTWSEFNGSWIGARGETPDFWIFRYEDMISDPFTNLTRLANVLGMNVGPEDINRAIENSTPERLRELERKQRNKHKILKLGRNTSPYVRAATSNQWQTALSAGSVKLIESAWGKMMRDFDYLT